MSIYTANGVVNEIGDLKEGETNGKPWRLRSFVIEDGREWEGKTYSDFLEFTSFGKYADGVDELELGDKVEVSFSIGSRKRTSKDGNEYWSTTLKAIGAKIVEESNSPAVVTAAPQQKEMNLEPQKDDLPF